MGIQLNLDRMKCPCGACDGGTMDPAFLNRYQNFCDHLGYQPPCNSGFRCPAHNAAVGGEPDSLHLAGRAIDNKCPDSRSRWELLKAALCFDLFNGVGVAAGYVHTDDRGRPGDTVPFPRVWDYYK